MIRRWRNEIKNSFIKVKIGITKDEKDLIKRLSNGPMEGTNARLKCIIKTLMDIEILIDFVTDVFLPLIKMKQY